MTTYGYKHWTLEETPRCFYVGKGLRKRPFSHRGRNHKWHVIVKRFGLHVEVCIGPVTNEEACAWEVEQIGLTKTFSTSHSHDDLTDVGCNFTTGGEGAPGRIVSGETRQRQRLSHLGQKLTIEQRRAFDVAIAKKKKSIAQCDAEGNCITVHESVRGAARAVGGQSTRISQIANGTCKRHTHRGYRWRWYDAT